MKLNILRLRNFKGIKSCTLDIQGGDTVVFGRNGTGKTTLADAFMWILFGKDSRNQSQFDIKTLDAADGQPIHGLEHEVEAVLELPDGTRITLRKVYKEKWTKRRGAATAEFTGHTTDHFVDDVPVSKTKYTARVAEIADEDVFRLLADPTHFNANLHWQDRRALLLEVCGDISDADVIASDKALAALPDILGDRTIDDHRAVVQAQRRKINEELKQIPARIDEVGRGLPDASEADPDALAAELADLREQRKAKDTERTRVETGGEVAQKQKRLAEVETEILEMERKSRAGQVDAASTERGKLREIQDDIDDAQRDIRGCKKDIEDVSAAADELEKRLSGLRDKWAEVDAEVFEYNTSDTCPTCGQGLPADQVEDAREKALAAFNMGKAEKLEAISAEGKRLAAEAKAKREVAKSSEENKADAEKRLANLQAKAKRLQVRIEKLDGAPPTPAALPPEHAKLAMERDRLTMEIAELQEGNTTTLDRLAGEIEALDQEITVAAAQIARVEQRQQGEQRIAELGARERQLAAEYEDLEHELHLIDEFTRAKVALLDTKINSRFKHARFQLFKENINGGIEPCCETLFNGVPYGSNLNTGARVLVGLDIINTLSDHYGFAPPVFADNAESVTEFPETRGQLIRLVHSPKDKALRVERKGESLKEAI